MVSKARTFRGLTGVALALGLTLTACSGGTGHSIGPTSLHTTGDGRYPPDPLPDNESVAVPLKQYTSCDEALATLRLAQAAVNANRNHSFSDESKSGDIPPLAAAPGQNSAAAPGQDSAAAGANPGARSGSSSSSKSDTSQSANPDHSTTNTAEPGVDEPDTVKNDGKRIVTVSRGTVYVASTADKRLMGSVQIPNLVTGNPYYDGYGNSSSSSSSSGSSSNGSTTSAPSSVPYGTYRTDGSDQLLMAGDRVLAISRLPYAEAFPEADGDVHIPGTRPQMGGAQTQFTLIDISDPTQPKVVSTLRLTGDFIDARMMGTTVRAITRTNPVLPQTGSLPGSGNSPDNGSDNSANNTSDGSSSSGTGWLPHYELQSHFNNTGGPQSVTDGTVNCASVSHPDVYSGTSLLSLETFDLGAAATRYSLGTGNPVSVVADGETVYATGSSLYIANDLHAWQSVPLMRPGLMVGGSKDAPPPNPYMPPTARTEIYKFDVSGTGAPRPAGSGTVPGWLLNQYSLSEYQGNLRIATTSSTYQDHADANSSSAVYVLAPRGDTLARVGAVTGLGRGEKIYSVRFAGPVGYVVTFRQMDPLFVIDLRDPAHPKAAGQLELTGYSSYLHPVDDKTLIGLGQAATTGGRRLGTQVSLFDVSDPSAPRLTARYELPSAYSSAEGDPHAFLYWAPTGMLVVPVSQGSDGFAGSASGALVLRVGHGEITEEGFVKHAGRSGGATFGSIPGVERITRSLVANDTLWTVSGAGLLASNGLTLEDMGWIPYP